MAVEAPIFVAFPKHTIRKEEDRPRLFRVVPNNIVGLEVAYIDDHGFPVTMIHTVNSEWSPITSLSPEEVMKNINDLFRASR